MADCSSLSVRGHGFPKRFLPWLLLAAGFMAFFALGLHRYISFDTLRQHRDALHAWVDTHAVLAPLAFMGIYIVFVALSLPGAEVLSMTGGLLFGVVWGTVYIVISATLGATLLFLMAKITLGDDLRAKAGPWLRRMGAGFQDNALSYLLVLWLIPLFPFFIVNLGAAFLGVSWQTYVLGTFIGIIPGTFVYASVGAGLDSLLAAGGDFSAQDILTPRILTALTGLAVLALMPVLYKKVKGRSH
jgi:uncharacterized membrane protein YdjX (TVP38/TMEM64 family)